MSVPKEALIELKQIHLRSTGELLTDAQAQEMAEDLFRLFLAVYEPIPMQWLEEFPHLKNNHTHND
jgi:hypothetical protein